MFSAEPVGSIRNVASVPGAPGGATGAGQLCGPRALLPYLQGAERRGPCDRGQPLLPRALQGHRGTGQPPTKGRVV